MNLRYKIHTTEDDFEKSIYEMLYDAFEIVEIRAKVGKVQNISFEIKTKEQGHFEPHVHVKGENYEASISLISMDKIEGNLPIKNQKIVIEWISNNIEKLRSIWCDYHKYSVELCNSLIGIRE